MTRPAVHADAHALATIAGDAGLADSMTDVKRQIDEYPDGFFVAEINGKVAGYLVVREAPTPHCVPARNPLQVWRLYVAGDHHRQGVARQLMGKAFLHAHSRGHEVLWLGLAKENTSAIAFYERCGFFVVGHAALRGPEHAQDLIMVCTMGT